MDAADAVARAGVSVITTETVRDALEILETEHISGAILDFKVRDGAVTPIVQYLRRSGIPFRIVSGSAIREIEANGIHQNCVPQNRQTTERCWCRSCRTFPGDVRMAATEGATPQARFAINRSSVRSTTSTITIVWWSTSMFRASPGR